MNEVGRKDFLRKFDSKLQEIKCIFPELQQLKNMIPDIISFYQNEVLPSGILNEKDYRYCACSMERLELINEGWDFCNPLP